MNLASQCGKVFYLFRLCVLSLTMASFASAGLVSAAPISRSDVHHWRYDLHYMDRAIRHYHKNAFHSVSEPVFRQAVRDLDARIPLLSRYDIIVGLKRIIALVGDEHTGFGLSTGQPTFFHTLPLKIYKYSDGYFVQSAPPEYGELVGRRITRIGKMPVEAAMARLHLIADTSNEWSFLSDVVFLMRGEALHSLGITDSDNYAKIRVATPSGEREVDVRVYPRPLDLGYNFGAPPGTNWLDSREAGTAPLYLRDQDKFYWYELTPDKTLYIHLKFVLNSEHGESLAQFFDRAFNFADANDASKVVLDIRNNGGGNNELTPAIIRNIVQRPRFNTRGKFFVIIGRGTASAAQNLTDRLQRDTNAIFVGEPTSEWPNHYGDPQEFILPYSHIAVHISSLFWQDLDPRDSRKWTGPDAAAELSSEQYRQNIDPAMDVVSSWHDTALTDVLIPLIAQKDTKGLDEAYHRFFREPLHKFSQEESRVDALAHALIDSSELTIALELFRLNTETNPKSSLAYDGLGDAFMAQKDYTGARKAYLTALKLNSKDAIAASSLSQLDAAEHSKR